jgi:hypothetical protein
MVLGGEKNIVPVVLCVPERQLPQAQRLALYCLNLDGTKVDLIVIPKWEDEAFVPRYPENPHSLQSFGFHRGARQTRGPFIWLECDSIPLKPGWVGILMEEYKRRCKRKQFLLSRDSKRWDKIGGIGVYPDGSHKKIPLHFEKSGWDLWLIEKVPHLVARTRLIQHSYCKYGPDGFCQEEHRFPRDQAMLRPEAVIFHRDPSQSLIP